MAAAGFFSGIIMPSRDMIVREVTPPGSFGKVFGFVTTGFNIGGIVSPLMFGAIMDHGSPRWVFLLVAAFSLLAILTVVTRPRRANRGRSQTFGSRTAGLVKSSRFPPCEGLRSASRPPLSAQAEPAGG